MRHFSGPGDRILQHAFSTCPFDYLGHKVTRKTKKRLKSTQGDLVKEPGAWSRNVDSGVYGGTLSYNLRRHRDRRMIKAAKRRFGFPA
jgi:hypothetical protein